jgi:CubicO group peptidase (beta-lactamase class C family)
MDLEIKTPAEIGLNEQALKNLDNAIQKRIDNGQIFGAAVIVARGGKIGYRKAFGTASGLRESSFEDLYLTMSCAKSFTSALALHFIDKGLLSLNTFVGDIIPNFSIFGKDKITLRHLLNHTAGVHASIAPPFPYSIADLIDFDKMVTAYCTQPLVYETGSRAAYTQIASHALVGKMIELTDPKQRKFKDIAREDLFEPLEMNDTSFGLSDPNNSRRVPVAYTEKMTTPSSAFTAAMLDSFANGIVPGGGGFTTIDDLFKFADAMRQQGNTGKYRLISKSLFEYASQNSTGEMVNHAWDFAENEKRGISFPANFHLIGGYARGKGHFLTPCGSTASEKAIAGMGGGSTAWMVDPERDLTVAFLSSGFIEGLDHLHRVAEINDLALSACE